MKVLSKHRAFQSVSVGMSDLAKLVGTTYGPHGGIVAVDKKGKPFVTTDGSALVNEVRFQGAERLGAGLIRAATKVVDDQVGDGTTTTVILANALVSAAGMLYSRDWNPTALAQDIRGYLPAVESLVRAMVLHPDSDTLRQVALMSSHGDDLISSTVVDAVTRVGETGTVLVQAGDGTGIDVENRDGLVLTVGWASHGMGKGDGTPRDLEGPLVAVVADPLSSFEDVRTMMEESSQWPGRGLVLFCPSITNDALTTLLINDHKEVIPCLAVAYKHPSPGVTREWLEDIATVTNAELVSKDTGHDVKNFQSQWLGSARKITVGKDKTTILSYPDDAVQERIGHRVNDLLRRAESSTSDYDRDKYRERAGAIDGGLTILRVGGHTTMEAQDRRSRTEDALRAVQQALQSGLVPGAGRAFHFVSVQPELQDTPGGRVLSRALQEPLRVLCERSGVPLGSLDIPQEDPWVGWCPVRKSVGSLWEAPAVVDPLNVVLAVFRAAVSVACETIKTGVVLTSKNRLINLGRVPPGGKSPY